MARSQPCSGCRQPYRRSPCSRPPDVRCSAQTALPQATMPPLAAMSPPLAAEPSSAVLTSALQPCRCHAAAGRAVRFRAAVCLLAVFGRLAVGRLAVFCRLDFTGCRAGVGSQTWVAGDGVLEATGIDDGKSRGGGQCSEQGRVVTVWGGRLGRVGCCDERRGLASGDWLAGTLPTSSGSVEAS
jgi:hypothetical protein